MALVWMALEFEVWAEAGSGPHSCFGLEFEMQASGRRQEEGGGQRWRRHSDGASRRRCLRWPSRVSLLEVSAELVHIGAANTMWNTGLGDRNEAIFLRMSSSAVTLVYSLHMHNHCECREVSTCAACGFIKKERRVKQAMRPTSKEHEEFCGAGAGTLLCGDGSRCAKGDSVARMHGYCFRCARTKVHGVESRCAIEAAQTAKGASKLRSQIEGAKPGASNLNLHKVLTPVVQYRVRTRGTAQHDRRKWTFGSPAHHTGDPNVDSQSQQRQDP
ncbi:hypothetical protein B0H17DRAFT_1292087 [Mycena rosella]|uniref:Uncharacterized protein n=1 Tax=Mycena rosella TaxID=1033263 RepID=A0AAD7BHG5_MYCRO|nr:hypothetical protein B0H17DRAFT_1292087 [Mycena rosella]